MCLTAPTKMRFSFFNLRNDQSLDFFGTDVTVLGVF